MPVKIDPELKLPEKFKTWREDQWTAIEAITGSDKPHFLLDAPVGIGKCLGFGTPILMADGSVKAVQNIGVGEMLMGPDSQPRMVLKTNQGYGRLYKIIPKKGEPFVVNEDHVLSLKVTNGIYKPRKQSKGDFRGGLRDGQILNLSVNEYLDKSKWFRQSTKLYRVSIDFPLKEVKMSPYFLGLWLGDGTKRSTQITTSSLESVDWVEAYACSLGLKPSGGLEPGCWKVNLTTGYQGGRADKNPLVNWLKEYGVWDRDHVPQDYKINSREIRLQILAGLIDTDGYYGHGCYEIINIHPQMAADIAFIARSSGFWASISPKIINGIKYFRTIISGNIDIIPCLRIKRQAFPRRQKKDVLVSGFDIEPLGNGNYYGFELKGDGLFLLGDFTVTHNSLVGIGVQRLLDRRAVYLCGTKQLQQQIARDFGDLVVILKGKANYPCLVREEAFPEITAEDCQAGKPRECRHFNACPYYQQKELAKASPLVVLNNAYYLNEVNGFQSVFSGAEILIADEVDSLDNALMSYIEFKITSRQLEYYALPLPENPQLKESWLNWIPRAVRQLEQQVSYAESRLRQCGFQNWGKTEIQENKTKKAMQKLIDKLSFLAAEVSDNWIFYYEDHSNKGYEFIFKPVNVGKYANRYLWDHAEYKVGMSGTIFSAEITCRELGIEECDYLRLESPFPVENRPIYYKPAVNLSKKTLTDQLPLLREAIDEDLRKYPTQKVLIHTVSYQLRDYLRNHLVCQERLMTHESGDREEALESFKANRRPLVMLSPSFDRGVDLPEADNCGAVMICKMPYLSLGDPQIKAKVDLPGGWTWYALKACQTLVQMTGRSVRSPRQRCDTYIYDAQFARLRSRMGEVLPAWWQAAIQEVDPRLTLGDVLI